MKFVKLIKKYHTYNEDCLAISSNLFCVIDGATFLKNKDNRTKTETSKMVKDLSKMLKKYKGDGEELKNYIYKCSKELSKKYDDTNSCGFSLAYFYLDKIYIYYLGDCECLIKNKDDEIITIYDDSLSKLDDYAISKMIEISKKENISIKEARSKINDILIENRNKKNKKNGYSIFEASVNPTFEIYKKVINKKDVKEILLSTDGYQAIYKVYRLIKKEDIFTLDLKDGYNRIKEVSFLDKMMNKYPRFKVIDDISAVKIDIDK